MRTMAAVLITMLAFAACNSDNSDGDQSPTPTATASLSGSSSPMATTPTAGSPLRDITQGLVSLHIGSFIDATTGWIVVNESPSNLLRTIDAGVHWTRLHKFSGIVADLDFADAQHGWVTTYEGIEQTQDGGESWTKLSTTITNPRSSTGADDYELKGAQHIDFVDSLHGWVAGTDELFRTADGGSTWTVISVPCSPHPEKGFTYTGAISFIDPQTGWTGCPSPVTDKDWPLFKTTDGGETWEPLPRTSFGASQLAFVDQTTGWAGTGGLLYATGDGGQTWIPARTSSGQDIVTPMPATAQDVYAIYGSTALQASSDGAKSWRVVYPPPVADAPTCTPEDLEATASWMRSSDPGPGTTSNEYGYTGIVHGVITLTNTGVTGCRLTSALLRASLLDSTGQAIVQSLDTPIPGGVTLPFVLEPGASAGSSVDWGQWCASPPNAPLTLVLDVPDVGEVTVGITDDQGGPITPPYCHSIFGNASYVRPGGLGPTAVPANPP